MSSEWESLTVGDLVRTNEATVQTGPFGSQLHSHDYVASGTAVIPTEAIGRGRILDVKVPQVGPEKAAELSRHRLVRGDILFARRGAQATGLAAIVDRRHEGALCGTGALLLRLSSERIDPSFLAWHLASEQSFSWLRTHAVGAVMPNLNTDIIKKIPLLLPSIGEQKLLARFLDSLDDRIALLRETNATLEAIAQALFKSWFVDFDPVRAKSQGLAPAGMDDATAALCPDSIDSWRELATRPKASELIAMGVLLIGDGYRAKNDELGQPGVSFVRAGDLDSGQITPTKDFLANPSLKAATGKVARSGDTAFTSKGTIGRFAFVDDASGEAVYSPQVCFWRSLDRALIEPAYLHYWMKSAAFTEQVNAVRGQAAIMDYVSLADQRRMALDLPPIAIQRRFAEVAESLLRRISCNRAAAMILATLRDTLLPRLISGQLRLPDAEATLDLATT